MTDAVIQIGLEEWESSDPVSGSLLHGMHLQNAKERETAQRLTDAGILMIDDLRNGREL